MPEKLNTTLPTRLTLAAAAPSSADSQKFAAQLKDIFNVVLLKQKKTESGFSLEFEASSIKEMISAAETGRLDEILTEAGGDWVQFLSKDGERVYDHLPAIAPKSLPIIIDVDAGELLRWKKSIDVVLLTVTPAETEALYEFFRPLPGTNGLLEGALSHATYRLGQFGRYCAAHVECTVSGEGRDGSTLTVQDAIKELAPKVVMLLGIAFGMDRRKQRLGDVLVAETVLPYELLREGEVRIQRGQPLPCGPTLSERFRTRRIDWKYQRGTEQVLVHSSLVLSGAKLVDSVEFRNALLAANPTAVGGEMESAGAYAAAHRLSVEVILVKAICDWADGLKNDRGHQFAARTSVALAHHVLSKKEVLKKLGATEVSVSTAKGTTTSTLEKLRTESPMVGRGEELEFLNRSSRGAVAIFVQGFHGVGKTRLIREFSRQSLENQRRPTSYIDFQTLECMDAPWAHSFLPQHPKDGGLFDRLWKLPEALSNLEEERIVVFDELESLLFHMKETAVLRFLQQMLFSFDARPAVIFVTRKNWPMREGMLPGSPRLGAVPHLVVNPLASSDGVALARQLLSTTISTAKVEVLAREVDLLCGGIPQLLTRWSEEVLRYGQGIEEMDVQSLRQLLMSSATTYFWTSWEGMELGEKMDLVRRTLAKLQMVQKLPSQQQSTSIAPAGAVRLARLSPALSWFVATVVGAPECLVTRPGQEYLNSLLTQCHDLARALGDVSSLYEDHLVAGVKG